MSEVSEAQRLHDAGRDPCQRYACKLQDCLEKNGYQENKCQHVIKEIYKCCHRHREMSIVCSGFLRKLASVPLTEG
jgi:hypothetical protein